MVLRHGVIWFSIGSSSAVRSCRSDGCNSGVITCVVWMLITVDISGYVLCMPMYIRKKLSEAIQHHRWARNKYDTATHFLLSTFILTFNTHVLIVDSHVIWQAPFVINSI